MDPDFEEEKIETYEDIRRLSEVAWLQRLYDRALDLVHFLGRVHGGDPRNPIAVRLLLDAVARCLCDRPEASLEEEEALAHELRATLCAAVDAVSDRYPQANAMPPELAGFYLAIDLSAQVYIRSLRFLVMRNEEPPRKREPN